MGWGLNKLTRDALISPYTKPGKKPPKKAKSKTKAAPGKTCIVASAAGRGEGAAAPPPEAGAAGLVSERSSGEYVVVVDMNAKVRQKAVDIPGSPLSLWKVAWNVLNEIGGVRAEDAENKPDHIVMVFDSPQSMPRMRSGLWAARYAKPNPRFALSEKQAADAKAFLEAAKRSSAAAKQPPPVAFGSLFLPGDLKRLTWQTMEHLVRRAACKLHADGKIKDFTLVASDHTVFSTRAEVSEGGAAVLGLGGRFAELGEADLKVFAVALMHLKRPKSEVRHVEIKSIDTDLLLQAVATVEAGVPQPRFTISLKEFAVDARAMIRGFGGSSVVKRLETVFWWIMAGGTDYSKPASDQGYLKPAMLDLTHPKQLTESNATLFIELADRKNIAFRPSEAVKKLQTLKGTRRVQRDFAGKATKSGRSLTDAVREAVVCTAYYGMLNTNPDADFARDVATVRTAPDVPFATKTF